MKVCVLHRPYRNSEWHTRFTGEALPDDAVEEALHHAEAIRAGGHEAEIVTWTPDVKENAGRLLAGSYDLVVNASSLPEVAVLEALGLPFMGSGLNLVALDKSTRKRLWRESAVLTPRFLRVDRLDQLAGASLPSFPLFVKPVRGRGSAGITDESIVNTPAELERACRRVIETMGQGALVEEYVQGTEVTVGLIGNNGDLTVLPPLEIEYSGTKTNTYEHKQDREVFHCPARLDAEALGKLRRAAEAAFVSLEARDFGRVDFIYDHRHGLPYALELNTFAGLQLLSGAERHLHSSYIGKMAQHLGWTSAELFRRLLTAAQERLAA
ncbi:MAG: D-alanine--D-alanine ligase family protein [Bacillota bacterium]